MAHAYAHLHNIPTTCLRFFTVYGPWGRPDMAYFKFTRAIDRGEVIDVYGDGVMRRDFTYIDDVVEGLLRVASAPPAGEGAPYRLYNIGRGAPSSLEDFIAILESALGKTAMRRQLPIQPGDVPVTWADVRALANDHGYRPDTPLDVGLRRFVDWYVETGRIIMV